MFSKHHLFILVALLFVFTYPAVVSSWSLNEAIGWGFRPLKTFLIPLWFLLIFWHYQQLAKKNKPVSATFFWWHWLLSALPVFFINYPFARFVFFRGNTMEEQFSSMYRVRYSVYSYYLVQLIFYGILLVKSFKPGKVSEK